MLNHFWEKSEDIQFTVTSDKEKHVILTSPKQPMFHLYLESERNHCWISKIMPIHFYL